MEILAQVPVPVDVLKTGAKFGWATFVLVLLIVVIAGFLWLWLVKVAIPRLGEQQRHNEQNEKLLRDLSGIIQSLKQSLDTHEAIARRSQRFYHAMSDSKKLELQILKAVARKLNVDVSSEVSRASARLDEADKITDPKGYSVIDE